MKALIAHRRSVRDSDGHEGYLLAIGQRNPPCFNGFNVAHAFDKQNDPTLIMVTDQNGSFHGGSRSRYLLNESELRDFTRGKTLGEWECLGIGWLFSNASNNPTDITPCATASTNRYDWAIGNELRKEGFMEKYYDGFNDVNRRTTRQLTPNEQFLSNAFAQFEKEQRVFVPPEVIRASQFAQALNFNATYAGCLYQFVGSERPSGQAVAYLQTFRNVSEVQWSGWQGTNENKLNILHSALRLINSNENIYALMDLLVNYGTDNAITCYAGPLAILHSMKYGFWSLREFFRNSESMLSEGRYNKGAQSEVLASKLRERANALRINLLGEASDLIESLRRKSVNPPSPLANTINPARIFSAARTGTLDRYCADAAEAIRAYARSDATPELQRFITHVRNCIDLRVPEVPPAPAAPRPQGAAQSVTPRNTTAGAAQGFVQWTSIALH